MKPLVFIIIALFSVVLAQTQVPKSEIKFAGNLNSATNNFRLSFLAVVDDPVNLNTSLRFEAINIVVLKLAPNVFYNVTGFTEPPTNGCELRDTREEAPLDAPYLEKQTYGMSIIESSARFDPKGDIVVTGRTQASFPLLQRLYPAPPCDKVLEPGKEEDCDVVPATTTLGSITLRLSSTSTTSLYANLKRIISAGPKNTTQKMSFHMSYVITSALSSNEKELRFKPYILRGSNYRTVETVAVELIYWHTIYFWRTLTVQPIGIKGHTKLVCDEYTIKNYADPLGKPRFYTICAKWHYLPDLSPTGPKGLKFGQPGANTQWSKAGIRFTWLPMIYIHNTNYKVLDDDAEEEAFYNTYEDPLAVEIFFAHQFTPYSKAGGGFCVFCGTSDARIVSTEYMIDDCYKDFTHLAHELGHVLDLSHPPGPNYGLSVSSTNTLMCPSGYCNDNPARNSFENQMNANNPLITFTLSLTPQIPDDCNASSDCGYCP